MQTKKIKRLTFMHRHAKKQENATILLRSYKKLIDLSDTLNKLWEKILCLKIEVILAIINLLDGHLNT